MAKNRTRTYETPQIALTFDASTCSYSGYCVLGLHVVLDRMRK